MSITEEPTAVLEEEVSPAMESLPVEELLENGLEVLDIENPALLDTAVLMVDTINSMTVYMYFALGILAGLLVALIWAITWKI